ncbi:MAG: ATP-binding protein [Thermoplasmata archaeon]
MLLTNALIAGLYSGNESQIKVIARELFQNAVDALVPMFRKKKNKFKGRVNIWVTKYGILVMDNGIGMDRNTLREAYGTLGTSMKEDIVSAGFYGIGGKSVMASTTKVYIISFHDNHRNGSILSLAKGSKRYVYDIHDFPNRRSFRGTIIFFRNSQLSFPLPDPALYNSPWAPGKVRVEYAYEKFLQEITFLARYYSFYAYVNGWDVEIRVNGRPISLPREIISREFHLTRDGNRYLFVLKKAIVRLEEWNNTPASTLSYSVISEFMMALVVLGISYGIKVVNMERISTSDFKDIHFSNMSEDEKKEMALKRIDTVYIDNAFEFSPSRSLEELLVQLESRKEDFIKIYRKAFDEMIKYYQQQIASTESFGKNNISKDGFLVLSPNKNSYELYPVPYTYNGGDFLEFLPEKVLPKISGVKYSLGSEIFNIHTYQKYYLLHIYPVPRYMLKGYDNEYISGKKALERDSFGYYHFLSIVDWGNDINGFIFFKDREGLKKGEVEIIFINNRNPDISATNKQILNLLMVAREYVPEDNVVEPDQTAVSGATDHISIRRVRQADLFTLLGMNPPKAHAPSSVAQSSQPRQPAKHVVQRILPL